MQLMHFILDEILKPLTYNTPFYHYSLQSYVTSKTVRFLAHAVDTESRPIMVSD